MYKDRGIIKWAPFDALVGFNSYLSEMIYEKEKISKPVLLEDKLEELDFILSEAFKNKLELQIEYFENGYIKTMYDHIKKIDYTFKEIKLNSNIIISIYNIIDLIIYD